HNFLPHLDVKNHRSWFIIIFPVTFPFVVYAARLIVRGAPTPPLAFRRAFIFLICGFYTPALYSFWNLLTRQDFLPYYPLAFVLVSGALLAVSPHLAKYKPRMSDYLLRFSLPAFIGVLELLVVIATR